ncbi:MAG: DUF3795 domain-containing protein [Clostridiaceae bacterium]|nr:DUF3795 domain-containing protein [Clostridiaceae bacterium]NBH80042.1 DUF3795 domain-containing protein [Clostridiaceae bacterium]NBI81376.1 DUF3795 domain-containing protein [Clostridiaceae bacterium]
MKGFERENQLFSLCGLNCGLCPMRIGGYCGGCGNGNQSCRIARCSLEQGGIQYCCECGQYPCETYQDIDRYDSFITHKRRKADLERMQQIGIDAYSREQEEKVRILEYLLACCNDGRRKNFFCVAVNLLGLDALQEAAGVVMDDPEAAALPLAERCARVVNAIQSTAKRENIQLKLNKKPKKKP